MAVQGGVRETGAARRPPQPALTEEEEEQAPEVLLSVVVQHGQVGLCFYDSRDFTLHHMADTPDGHDLHLLARVIQEVSPHVIITSAKQERCMAQFMQRQGSNPDYRPEVVVYPSVDFGVEVSKQRLLSAHLPFLPASVSERGRASYLSSCLSFDSLLMLRSVGALLKCLDRRRVGVELEDCSVGVPILQFLTYTLKDVVYIDRDTYSVLQIFKSELHPSVYKLQSGEKEGLSLYGILNRCKCKFGSKMLRQWFLRPSRDLALLNRRQTVVRFFSSPRNSDTLRTLQGSLSNIRNVPNVLRRMSLCHTTVSDWQSLYKTVYSAVCIRDTLRSLPQSIQLFQDISEGFSDDLYYIASLISRVIGFLLSVPRLPSMVEKEDFMIEGLDFMFLSEERLHYRSQRTKELDNLLGDLHCDIRDMETAVMTQLQSSVLERSACLYKVLDLTAELDCLMALSHASQEYGYTSPSLANHRRIVLAEARHPLLQVCSPVLVSNSFQSSNTQGRVKVITGPNSSGKSMYLKQVGLIVFMALIGSDVPAREAEIGLVDGIFTRMQSRESVSVGLSTFMIDLKQMAHALNHSTGESLVLIDEFGKGTNTVDGLSLLAASVSHWLKRVPAEVPHVLLATNFHSLLQLGLLPSSSLLSLLTLETTLDGEELVFLYQLKEGICCSSYAANIASLAGLPSSMVQRGLEVSELYRTGKTINRIDGPSSEDLASSCARVVDTFMSVDLEDSSVDLQIFMKEQLLPSGGGRL
ncbi:mutS protein homolog 5 isoform X5 [Osmerus eperlanus]|uniref:mutS protein homolog 5 isoform X5 n=1 Tax=Osmerus eperlanus TaxID=29151 RepID=UPI002E13257B